MNRAAAVRKQRGEAVLNVNRLPFIEITLGPDESDLSLLKGLTIAPIESQVIVDSPAGYYDQIDLENPNLPWLVRLSWSRAVRFGSSAPKTGLYPAVG